MTYYRIFFHAGRDIVRVVEFEGEHDDAARAIAEQHRGPQRLELWQGARLVETYEPNIN